MFENLTKMEMFAMLTGTYTACLIISNIIAGKTFDCFSLILPCSIIVFPLIYILNDVLTEIYGYEKVKKVIILGFIINVFAIVCYNIAMALPAPSFFENSHAYSVVLGATLRLLIAGFVAYFIGSFVNAKLMVMLKEWDEEKLFVRCVSSTFFGESLDALIFITLGFFGTMPLESLVIMIATQAIVKTIYEILVYPVTRTAILFVRKLPEN
ncbi:queuosine precursor transporter [uncultured Methanobrevibacter sp.]|uniref:queuosine precursor transporter n=1 Tax=uncultured Methanobrevibacter sp. TaxID=253161 RepID=UPI002610B211|nr:queuosine precursor transporter [uncultured Methanobrevibacter sp.]